MKLAKAPLFALAAALFPVAVAAAATIDVEKGGSIATIQAGIDAAGQNDTVRVGAGVYQENLLVPAGKNGVTIEADGKVTIEALPAGGAPGGPGIIVESKNVTLEGLTIRNAEAIDADHPSSGVVVRATGFHARKLKLLECEFGIELEAGKAVIEDGSFQGQDVALFLSAVADVRIEGCLIRQCADAAILAEDCSDLEILSCTIVGISGGNGITVDGVTDVTIRDCEITNCQTDGVLVVGTSITVRDCVIDSSSSGMEIDGQDIAILDNELRDLEGNPGLVVLGGSNVLIEGNTLRDFDQEGIDVDSGVTKVTIRGNTLRDGFSLVDAAIEINGDQCIVEDNLVQDCANDGYFVSGDANALIGNRAKRCVKDGFDVASSAAATLLDDNLADDCGAEGLDHGGSNSTIRNNTFKHCRIDLTNDGTATFTNNKFTTGGEATPPEID